MQFISDADWMLPSTEGQLSVDVFRNGGDLVVRSTVAGVTPDDVDILIHGDLLTIRGSRRCTDEIINEDQWFYRECYWGAFSRSIVLPYEVVTDAATSVLKNGVLEIRIPIRDQGKRVSIAWERD